MPWQSKQAARSKNKILDPDPVINKMCFELSLTPEEVRKMLAGKEGIINEDGSASGDANTRGDAGSGSPKKAAMASCWDDFLDDDNEDGGGVGDVAKIARIVDESKVITAEGDYKAVTPTTTSGGILVQSGTLDHAIVGRSRRSMKQMIDNPLDLTEPTILPVPYPESAPASLRKIVKIASSCTSVHCLAIGAGGELYGWGRNDSGQLGMGAEDLKPRTTPALINHPSREAIKAIATGKHHSIIIDASGIGYGCGRSTEGQCGVNREVDLVPTFRRQVVANDEKYLGINVKFAAVSCGEMFTVQLSDEGKLYSCGSSMYGQLGNGDEGQHIEKAGKIEYENECKLTRRKIFKKKKEKDRADVEGVTLDDSEDIRLSRVACGKNHTVVVEAEREQKAPRRVFTWGLGNYGCLGHKRQEDEFYPRLVDTIQGSTFSIQPITDVAAGSDTSMGITANGIVYYWGSHNKIKESCMFPKRLDQLAYNDHHVTSIAAGNTHIIVTTAGGVTFTSGAGPHGELGYGDEGALSSSKEKFVDSLDRCVCLGVTAGMGSSVYIVKDDDEEDKKAFKQLSTFVGVKSASKKTKKDSSGGSGTTANKKQKTKEAE